KEHPGAKAKLRRRQSDRLVHRQPSEPDIVAVEVVEDVGENEDRHQPPADLGEDSALRLLHRVIGCGPWCLAGLLRGYGGWGGSHGSCFTFIVKHCAPAPCDQKSAARASA